ncbi:MAG: D-Ala-D-Ala carboxypeptidase family metallohydrolase [Candidatus Methylomirabilales bacterium]
MPDWLMAPDGMVSDHFSWMEARCPCCHRVPSVTQVTKTANWLERVRAYLGEPMVTHSWCRCPKHNAAVGGVPNSLHTLGWAVDFILKGKSPREVQRLLKLRQGSQTSGGLIGGLGKAKGYSHIDRGQVRTWTYDADGKPKKRVV